MKKSLLSTITTLCCFSVFCQGEFSLGVKGGIALGTPTAITNTYLVEIEDDLLFERPAFNRSAGYVGIVARYDLEKSYLYADLAYTKMYLQGFTQSASFGGFGVFAPKRQLTSEIGGGVKVLSKIRLYTGLGSGVLVGKLYDKETRLYHEGFMKRFSEMPNNEFLQNTLRVQSLEKAYVKSPNRVHLTGKLGIGFDAGGAMIDLSYQRSLTPYISKIEYNNKSYNSKLNYGITSLSVAYRILPVNKFLMASRRNKVYKAEKAAIPFYKNEYSFLFGKEGEDINSMNVYENTYTRYFHPRFGLTIGLSSMSETLQSDNRNGFESNPSLERLFSGFVEAKFRPVYTLKNRLGVAGGLNIIKRSGITVPSYGSSLINGQIVTSYNFLPLNEPATLGYQATVDYQYLVTKKIGMGLWLRVNGENFDNSFAQFGLKTSILF